MEVNPTNINFISVKGQWAEESAQRAVQSWLKLSISQRAHVDLIGLQNDAMAIGARKVFQAISIESERDRWLSLAYTGFSAHIFRSAQTLHRFSLLIYVIVKISSEQPTGPL